DEVPGRFRTKLAEGRESAYLSQRLARIITDAPLQLEIDRCVTQEYDVREVLKLFQKLEFRSLTSRLAEAAEVMRTRPDEQPLTQAVAIRTPEELAELVAKLEAAPVISFDVETTGLDKMDAELVGICLAVEPPVGYYMPVGHLDGEAPAGDGQMSLFASDGKLDEGLLPLQEGLEATRPSLSCPDIPKVAPNGKFDYGILDQRGVQITRLSLDTMVAEWLNHPVS